MSTATLPPTDPVASATGRLLLTAADLARLPRTLATTDVRYELHDGRLVVMAPPGADHGRRQARFAAYLVTHGELRGHGLAYVEVGVLLRRGPDHLLGPDAAFLAADQLPPRLSPEGYLLTVPALVVEVRSRNDTGPELAARAADYLASGVRLVWVADPEGRTVTAYRSGEPPRVFGAAETLTAEPVIPGFAVPVAELLPA
jgi:Uma2 family endonuclease